MECHDVHGFAVGAFQEFLAASQSLLGRPIEAIFPVGTFQVQGMGGGISQVKQLLATRTQE
jgi:hypothetical protein